MKLAKTWRELFLETGYDEFKLAHTQVTPEVEASRDKNAQCAERMWNKSDGYKNKEMWTNMATSNSWLRKFREE